MTSVAPVAVVLFQRDQLTVEAPGASHDALQPLNSPSYPQQPVRRSRRPCESNPELFFLPDEDDEDDADHIDPRGQIALAKDICRRCPAAAECLETALAHDERFGIWGGMTEQERSALKIWRTQGPRRIGRAS